MVFAFWNSPSCTAASTVAKKAHMGVSPCCSCCICNVFFFLFFFCRWCVKNFNVFFFNFCLFVGGVLKTYGIFRSLFGVEVCASRPCLRKKKTTMGIWITSLSRPWCSVGGLLERRVQYIPCFQQNVALKELVWGRCHCVQVKGLGLGKVPLSTG